MSINDEKKRRGVSALDVFIIVMVIMCVGALIVRIAVGSDGVLPEGKPDAGEFALTFEVSSQRASAASNLTSGAVLYTENGEVFGTVNGQVSVTPAKIYSEDSEGKLVLTYSASEGDGSLVDIKGTMTVDGYKTDYGFLVGGKIFASPGYETTLHTEGLTAQVRILGITSISE